MTHDTTGTGDVITFPAASKLKYLDAVVQAERLSVVTLGFYTKTSKSLETMHISTDQSDGLRAKALIQRELQR
jgi:hypothetical protein